MQLTLDLFPKLTHPEMFDKTYYFEGESFDFNDKGYNVVLRREVNKVTGKIETCAIISGMNFLGQRNGTLFRCMTHRGEDTRWHYNNDVVLPELNDMTLEDIITFCRHTIENNLKGLYEWDYDHRCYIFTRVAMTLDERINAKIKAVWVKIREKSIDITQAFNEINALEDKRSSMCGWVFYADAYKKALGEDKHKEIFYRKAGIILEKSDKELAI